MGQIPDWVQTFGFPAVACVMLIYAFNLMLERHAKEREANAKTHKEFAASLLKEHSSERREWQTVNSEDRKVMTEAMRSLERAILTNNN